MNAVKLNVYKCKWTDIQNVHLIYSPAAHTYHGVLCIFYLLTSCTHAPRSLMYILFTHQLHTRTTESYVYFIYSPAAHTHHGVLCISYILTNCTHAPRSLMYILFTHQLHTRTTESYVYLIYSPAAHTYHGVLTINNSLHNTVLNITWHRTLNPILMCTLKCIRTRSSRRAVWDFGYCPTDPNGSVFHWLLVLQGISI